MLELGEATLLPGLVDTHTHLAFDASMDPTRALAELSDEQLGELIAANARQALRRRRHQRPRSR